MSEEMIEAIQTRWSLIQNAHHAGQPESTGEARRLLVMRYAPAVRRYLGAIVKDSDQADELTQDLLLKLMKGDFSGANPDRGRFRDFLKMAIRNLVKSSWQKSNKRRAVDADLELIANRADDPSELEWTQEWRSAVLDHVWNRLLHEEGGTPGAATHVLKLKTQFPDATSDDLSQRLSEKLQKTVSSEHCRQILKRARARFVGHLLDEIRAGLDSEDDARVHEELAALGLLEHLREEL